MNIIFIINCLEGRGGTERVATLLANQLSTYYQITILSKQYSSEKNAYILDKKVKDIKFMGSNLNFMKKCKRHISQNSPDIVIIHTMSKLTPALTMSGIKAKEIWSIEHIALESHSQLFQQARKRFYKKVDKVITLTEDDASRYRLFHEDVVVIANATPLPVLKKPINIRSKIIITIGRLTAQKGFDLLVKAWSQVEKNYSDWSLQIYGEGEDRDNLEQMIKDYNLNNITLKGITNDVQSVYDKSAFYVMSSRFEGFGMVLIEAQSRGLPIVSFDCPSGPAEIIQDDVNGYLVRNRDVAALAERISYLIDHESIRGKFSRNALLSAKRFKPEVIIKQWIDLINKERDDNGNS